MSEILPAIGKRESAAVAIALALASLVFLQPSIRGNDGVGNYVYLMSLFRDGDFDFSNEYAAFDLRDRGRLGLADAPRSEATGLPANRYGIGCALFWAPTVGLVHLLLTRLDPVLATGLGRPYEWAVGIASAWWGGLGLWLLYLRLRRDFDTRAAALALTGIVLATPLAFYLWMHGSMSHAVSFFIAVMALLALEQAWAAPRGMASLLLGAWSGLLVITRFQDVTWSAAFGLALVAAPLAASLGGTSGVTRQKAAITAIVSSALFALGAALALLPQMAVWKLLYGSWFSGPLPYLGREGGVLETWPKHLLEALFSQRGGALMWHPILIVALAGLFAARKRLGFGLFFAACLGLTLQLYLVASWSMWWGGASFGNRFFISSYPVLVFGLAYADESLRRAGWRRLAPALLGLLIAWNAGLLIQYGTQMISREKAEGWGKVVSNQFIGVPKWMWERVR
jgi:hypothetical protein